MKVPQIPAFGVEPKLKQSRGHAQKSPVSCCICSKHGLSLVGMPVLGGLERQILKTMLRTYTAARCVGGSALSISSKLGLLSATFHWPRKNMGQQLETMLRTYAVEAE